MAQRARRAGRVVIRLGVLVSGGGSNLQAILDSVVAGALDANVTVVISNKAMAGGLERARTVGIPTVVVDPKSYTDRETFDSELVRVLAAHGADYVVLAGFMRIVTTVLLDAFPMRVLNVHPSLLPAFPGVRAQAQALRYGARIAGCTVHFVDSGMDTGPILAQAAVPVLETDTEETLSARILAEEHALLPTALQWLAEGRVTVMPNARDAERPRVVVRSTSAKASVAVRAAIEKTS
jgi:phosphoribosylglycinamide formyltransferase 1